MQGLCAPGRAARAGQQIASDQVPAFLCACVLDCECCADTWVW